MAERRLSGPARQLVTLLAEHPGGLSPAELADYARARFRGLPASRVAVLVREAIAAGAINDDQGRLRTSTHPDDPANDAQATSLPPGHATGHPLHAVIVDLESVVRTTATEPYTDKRIYQVGAIRAGADEAWVAAAAPLTCWLELPDDEWVIVSDRVRAEHAAHAVPPAEALAALLAFADGADILVAYNGFAADFPLLAEACDREGLQQLPGEYVDAYYLTLAMWPTAPTHRLAHLAAAVGVPTDDLTWHDATADCVLLGRLLTAAADELHCWPEPLRDLIASTIPDSPSWRLLRELAVGGLPIEQERVHRHGEVAAAIQAELAGHRPRRSITGPTGRSEFTVEPTIVALANSWIVLNVGGPPTDDKPTVTLEPPHDPDHVSSFLNIRVADINAVYEQWRARGAEFLTAPTDRGVELRCYMRDPDGHLIEVGQTTMIPAQGRPG